MAAARWFTVSAALLLALPLPVLGQLAPLPEGPWPGAQAPALEALDSRLLMGGLYAVAEDTRQFFVADQMAGVLVALAAVPHRPDQAKAWEARALESWSRALVGYDASRAYFHKTIPPPDRSVCLDVETHAWALRAALALQRANLLPVSEAQEWVGRLRTAVLNLLEGGSHAGIPACGLSEGRLNPFTIPIPLWSLLDAMESSNDPRAGAALRNHLNSFFQAFDGGAYLDPSGIFNVVLNARLLVVVTGAARLLADEGLEARRDELANALRSRFLVDEEGLLLARHLSRAGAELRPEGDPAPLNQLWAAYALLVAGPPSAATNATAARLVDACLERFWSATAGGFANAQGPLLFEPNAMAALFFRSPALTGVVPDAPSLSFVVPGRTETRYAADDPRVLGRPWPVRFSLSSTGSGPRAVVLAVESLAPVNVSEDAPERARLYRLLSPSGGRQELPLLRTLEGRTSLIRFNANLSSSPTMFRLEAYAPLSPREASWTEDTIRLLIWNTAPEPIAAHPLRLELAAVRIDVGAVALNGLATPAPERVGPITTEEVPYPHLRILFPDLVLAPGENELVLSYRDTEAPVVEELLLFRDPQGQRGLSQADQNIVYQGETLHARARVSDNGALRSVVLNLFDPERGAVQVRMRETQPNWFEASFTVGNESGPATVSVTAADAARLVSVSSEQYKLKVEDPLFSGNVVLFVFAGTLFFTALVIWFKLRRKGRSV